MSEHELGKELVGQSAGDDRAMTERVIRRERRLVQVMTALTVALWTLSAAAVVTFYGLAMSLVLPVIVMAAHYQDSRSWHQLARTMYYFGLMYGWPMVIASAVLLVLAAISTVLLVYWSRRATLRLVDQRLEQILAELRRPPHAAG